MQADHEKKARRQNLINLFVINYNFLKYRMPFIVKIMSDGKPKRKRNF